jgi:hypothetical protein
VHPSGVSDPADVWIPLVDEPIGSIVREFQEGDPAVSALVESPQRLLAFRTFAYIRVGVLLGRLLVEQDVEPSDRWIADLLESPANRARLEAEMRVVAEEVAADPGYGEVSGPDEETRARFREFARRHLGAV